MPRCGDGGDDCRRGAAAGVIFRARAFLVFMVSNNPCQGSALVIAEIGRAAKGFQLDSSQFSTFNEL
jgi:hypothetical protein